VLIVHIGSPSAIFMRRIAARKPQIGIRTIRWEPRTVYPGTCGGADQQHVQVVVTVRRVIRERQQHYRSLVRRALHMPS
jgi:hypothetical protein